MLYEYKLYLSEMMMLKIDRTSMANSLEVRSPFVDHKLVEYMLSTSQNYFNVNNPKAILKEYLSLDFDDSFLNRKKMGFVFNLEDWIYKNLIFIKSEHKILENYGITKNIYNLLSINKSRINAHRIWRLYVIELYLKSLKKLIQ